MPPTLLTPLLLLLLLSPIRATRTTLRTDKISLQATATLSPNNTQTFPNDSTLPPILRSLTLTLDTATSPYLGPGRLTKTRTGRILIKFTLPRIKLRLRLLTKTSSKATYRISAKHTFRRPPGLRLHRSRNSVADAVNLVKAALAANPAGPRLVAEIDHAKAALSVGQVLPPSTVVVFGNPRLGSQLWTRMPAIGTELPTELHFSQTALGVDYVSWNTGSYLRLRFGLGAEVDMVLRTIDEALARLAGVGAGKTFRAAGRAFDRREIVLLGDGLGMRKGKGNVEMAFEKLLGALEAAPPVNVAYKVLHDVAAKNAGLDTKGLVDRVAVFGNPALGTSIMQGAFTAGIDLPARIAVWGKEGGRRFTIGFVRPKFVGMRHGGKVSEMLDMAVENFAGVAAGA